MLWGLDVKTSWQFLIGWTGTSWTFDRSDAGEVSLLQIAARGIEYRGKNSGMSQKSLNRLEKLNFFKPSFMVRYAWGHSPVLNAQIYRQKKTYGALFCEFYNWFGGFTVPLIRLLYLIATGSMCCLKVGSRCLCVCGDSLLIVLDHIFPVPCVEHPSIMFGRLGLCRGVKKGSKMGSGPGLDGLKSENRILIPWEETPGLRAWVAPVLLYKRNKIMSHHFGRSVIRVAVLKQFPALLPCELWFLSPQNKRKELTLKFVLARKTDSTMQSSNAENQIRQSDFEVLRSRVVCRWEADWCFVWWATYKEILWSMDELYVAERIKIILLSCKFTKAGGYMDDIYVAAGTGVEINWMLRM